MEESLGSWVEEGVEVYGCDLLTGNKVAGNLRRGNFIFTNDSENIGFFLK